MSEEETSQEPTELPPEEPEAEPKKKRKIDLKSRLSSVRAAGSMASRPSSSGGSDPLSFPPPPVGSVPPPRVLSSGGGLPTASSPFAPERVEVKPTAQQQTIKVEMGEEVVKERKKAGKRTVLVALLTAVIGIGAGFVIGGAKERGTQRTQVVNNAKALSDEIEVSNKKMLELSDVLRKGVESFTQDEFPEDLPKQLAQLNVPFGPENFDGKGVGALPAADLKMLIQYTSGVKELNDLKDGLRKQLSGKKDAIEKLLVDKSKPKVEFSVLFSKKARKKETDFFAELVTNKEPWEVNAEEKPEKWTVVRIVGGKPKDVDVVRYSDGDIVDKSMPAIPLTHDSVARFSSQRAVLQLQSKITEIKILIDGSDVRGSEKPSLIKLGKGLVDQLTKLAAAAG